MEYAYNDEELKAKVKGMGKGYPFSVTRVWAKWIRSVGKYNGSNQTFHRQGIEDAAEAEKMVTILMGDKIDSRRQYITTYANFNKKIFSRKWGCDVWHEEERNNFIQNPDRIISKPMESVMHESMMPYAEYVIMERALPRVEDGLKPVQQDSIYNAGTGLNAGQTS